MLLEVLLLSRMTGQDVLGTDGRVVGRLADLTVRLDEHAGPHLVERLLVRRHRAPDLLMPWAAIESFENTCVSDTRPRGPDLVRDRVDQPRRWVTTRSCSFATSSTPRSSTLWASDLPA